VRRFFERWPYIIDSNGPGILPGAAEEEFAQEVSWSGRPVCGAAQEKRAGAVAEESAEFTGDARRSERAAVYVGGDDGDHARLPGGDEPLRDGEAIQEPEASAANVERATSLTQKQLRVELRGERRKAAMGFACRNDPVELLCATTGGMQCFLRRLCSERKFVLAAARISERFYPGATAKFAELHAERPVDFLGRNPARAESGG